MFKYYLSFDLLNKLCLNAVAHNVCLTPISKRMFHIFTCNNNVDIKFSVRDAILGTSKSCCYMLYRKPYICLEHFNLVGNFILKKLNYIL